MPTGTIEVYGCQPFQVFRHQSTTGAVMMKPGVAYSRSFGKWDFWSFTL